MMRQEQGTESKTTGPPIADVNLLCFPLHAERK